MVAHDVVFWGKEHRQKFIQKPEATGSMGSRSNARIAFHHRDGAERAVAVLGSWPGHCWAKGQLCPSSPFALSLGWVQQLNLSERKTWIFWTKLVSSGIALKWRIYSLKSSQYKPEHAATEGVGLVLPQKKLLRFLHSLHAIYIKNT